MSMDPNFGIFFQIKLILCCIVIFSFSSLFTWLIRNYSLKKAILDIPNERSSHNTPTPRGGGIAIIFTFNLALVLLGYLGYLKLKLVWALLGGGSAVGLIGYCDDLYSLKIRWRLSIHFLAAVWIVFWLGGLSAIDLGTWKISLSFAGPLLTVQCY